MINKGYERERNKLIDLAMARAYRQAGQRPKQKDKQEAWTHAWNHAYHTTMDNLAREVGLT